MLAFVEPFYPKTLLGLVGEIRLLFDCQYLNRMEIENIGRHSSRGTKQLGLGLKRELGSFSRKHVNVFLPCLPK
jgi:hypothetical protein